MSVLPMDCHIHTTHSCDGKASMADMCCRAVEMGVLEIGFTDHLDRHPMDFCHDYYQPDDYWADLEACRAEFPELTIRAGVEVGEPHRFMDEVKPVLDAHPYDHVIGSLHWVGNGVVFDNRFFNKRSVGRVAELYFTEMEQMVRRGGFDILGHLDVLRRQGFDFYGRFDIEPFEDLIRPILRACIEGGVAVEINTSGVRRALQQTFPSLPVLRWYREMGGELLTVGSDAHTTEHLAYCFTVARDVALQAGFTRLCRFQGRRVLDWVDI